MAAPETLTAAGSAPITPTGRSILMRIAEMRAWLFLVLLIIVFEVWARVGLWRELRLQHLQSAVDLGFRDHSAASGARPDLRDHLGRHRPVARLRHGAGLGDRRARRQLRRRCSSGLPPLAAMLVGILCRRRDDHHSGPRQRLADRTSEGAAVHRHARHVRRGARLGLSVRRRHDRLGQQPVVQHRSATAAFSASRYW